ncbi:hypothetical protein TNCT_320311 [Trichonephila clavata]|uniref:Uncharacterized protein n=1 Tax=Trichonephila clavata TaxID=2740835 RepID=A0A8X6FF98_TRICU|nr:hypothetical protein TNCT_320311 [Trichonephila clavata]
MSLTSKLLRCAYFQLKKHKSPSIKTSIILSKSQREEKKEVELAHISKTDDLQPPFIADLFYNQCSPHLIYEGSEVSYGYDNYTGCFSSPRQCQQNKQTRHHGLWPENEIGERLLLIRVHGLRDRCGFIRGDDDNTHLETRPCLFGRTQ